MSKLLLFEGGRDESWKEIRKSVKEKEEEEEENKRR